MHAFGQSSDMVKFAPKAQLTAIVDDWGPYYIERVKAVIDGTWKTHNVWRGLKEGMVEIAPYGPAVPPDVAQAADKVKEGIIAGTLHPFDGPVTTRRASSWSPRASTDRRAAAQDGLVRQGRAGLRVRARARPAPRVGFARSGRAPRRCGSENVSAMATILWEWLNLGLRWLHVIAGIAWIGSSFYFVHLDCQPQAARRPARGRRRRGLAGPRRRLLPHGQVSGGAGAHARQLTWFKWEAYTTWLSASCAADHRSTISAPSST